MNKVWTTLLLSFISSSILTGTSVVVGQEWQFPLTAEDAIIEQELEWAERAMEGYKQKMGIIPTRSSIRARHVHTQDWRKDSISILASGSSADSYEMELSARHLRGQTKTATR